MVITHIKDFFEILTMLAIGGWSIFGFVVLKKRQKSLAELRKVDAETKKIEHELRSVAVLKIEIDVKSIKFKEKFILFTDVIVTNEGKRDTRLQWEGEYPALTVRKVTFSDGGIPKFSKPIELTVRQTINPNLDSVSHDSRVGQIQKFPFVTSVLEEGLYLVSFRVVMSDEEKSISVELGSNPVNRFSWTAKKYILVK